ncbi:MAG: inorganic diphosphatase [Clostridiales bacterium]|nr:inorganic diphosphatase [Clostridiales bacterium]
MKDLTSYLNKEVIIKIDRPLNSKHPEHDMIYPVNYGYIEGTISGDGKEIDAYIIGVDVPLETFRGIVIGIVKREDDNEDKLIVAAEKGYTKEELYEYVKFTEQYFISTIHIEDDLISFMHFRLNLIKRLSRELFNTIKETSEYGLYDFNYIKLNQHHYLQYYQIPVITYQSVDIGFNIDKIFIEKFYNKAEIIHWLDTKVVPFEYEIYGGESCCSFEGETMIEDILNSEERIIGVSVYMPYNNMNQIMTSIKTIFDV